MEFDGSYQNKYVTFWYFLLYTVLLLRQWHESHSQQASIGNMLLRYCTISYSVRFNPFSVWFPTHTPVNINFRFVLNKLIMEKNTQDTRRKSSYMNWGLENLVSPRTGRNRTISNFPRNDSSCFTGQSCFIIPAFMTWWD